MRRSRSATAAAAAANGEFSLCVYKPNGDNAK